MSYSEEEREQLRAAGMAGGMGHFDLDALDLGLCMLEGCLGAVFSERDEAAIAAVRDMMDAIRSTLVDEDEEL